MEGVIADIGAYYDYDKDLGIGTFSKVVMCTHKITGEKVALFL